MDSSKLLSSHALGIRIYILSYSSSFLPAHGIAFSQRRYSNPQFVSFRSLCQHVIPYTFKSGRLPTSQAPERQNRRYRFPVSQSAQPIVSIKQILRQQSDGTPLSLYLANTSCAGGTINKVGLRDMMKGGTAQCKLPCSSLGLLVADCPSRPASATSTAYRLSSLLIHADTIADYSCCLTTSKEKKDSRVESRGMEV